MCYDEVCCVQNRNAVKYAFISLKTLPSGLGSFLQWDSVMDWLTFQGLLIYEVKINILSSDEAGVQLSVEQMCFSAGNEEKRCASHAST